MSSTLISVEEGILIARIDNPELKDDVARDMIDTTVTAALHQPGAPVLLDLSKVTFMPSMAIGALVTLMKKLQLDRHRLILCGAQPPIRGVLALCRLDTFFQFADSETDARTRLATT